MNISAALLAGGESRRMGQDKAKLIFRGKLLCGLIEPGRGVLPMIGDRAEALVAIYPKGAGIDLIAALSGPDFSLQSVTKKLIVLGRLRIVSVSKKDQKLFQNLNERSDVHKM